MRYLLDTNIVSDLVRNPQGKIAEEIFTVGESQVCTSIIVAAELRYGAEKKQSPRLSAQLEAVLVQGVIGGRPGNCGNQHFVAALERTFAAVEQAGDCNQVGRRA